MSYGQVLLVDNGGFFPEEDARQDAAWFLMDMMKTIGIDAVNIGDRDLRFGRKFLEARAKKDQLPLVSANLLDKRSRKPVFAPFLVKKIGTVDVGVFGLISDKGNLGPGKDSLAIDDPLATARRTVTELKRRNVQAIVLLSQLGKVETEDLVSATDGIDAVEVGNNVLLVQKGRMVKNTIACYGGEQGQYVCRTELTLDAKGHVASGDAETVILSPEVGERPEIAALVKGFEDGLTEKTRKADMEKQAEIKSQSSDNNPSHYLGAELCMRCHTQEADQWKTTSHSVAWKTLVDTKSDSKAECITCHVVGYQKSGGFATAATTPQMANVQCESCHGMGTEHDGFSAAPHKVAADACITCHHGDSDPNFNFNVALAKVAHTNSSGETIKNKTVKGPEDAAKSPMKSTHGG